MQSHRHDKKRVQKLKRVVFLNLVLPLFCASMLYAHMTSDPVLLMVVSSTAVLGSDETTADRLTKSQGGGGIFFEEEFEEEFAERLESEVFDPLGGYNRFMTKTNDKFYFWILKPTASGYRKIIPQGARVSVNRFFNNLLFPLRFVNNILQLKFKGAGVELARFGLNTTVGVIGFGDPAQKWFNLNPYPEDFGQTLGYYGMGSGFHLVLPVIGPSNLRDTIGLIGDFYLDPICYLSSCYARYLKPVPAFAVQSYKIVNAASLHIGEYESIKKDAIDLYTFLRDAYEQSRKKEIKE